MKNLKLGPTKGYLIHKNSDTNYCLCKILGEYKNDEEATSDLIDLLTHKKTEEQIMKERPKTFKSLKK